MSRLSSLGVLAYLTGTVLGAALGASSQRQSANLTYEYIVVGSGAGGGPLASRLARAGHSVLLIEAGDDQGTSDHYAVPAFDFVAAEDPLMRWDFYVNHYQDQARAQRDPKYVYQLPNGTRHAGLHPPLGAKPLGIL
jgi:choline dehydrogenase